MVLYSEVLTPATLVLTDGRKLKCMMAYNG
jgi:hypothetical protein